MSRIPKYNPSINPKDDASLTEKKNEYVVNVGNIGNVSVKNKEEALKVFADYVKQSKSPFGRASGEDVILMLNGEPIKELWNINV